MVVYRLGRKAIYLKFLVERILARGIQLHQVSMTGAILAPEPIPEDCCVQIVYTGHITEKINYPDKKVFAEEEKISEIVAQ